MLVFELFQVSLTKIIMRDTGGHFQVGARVIHSLFGELFSVPFMKTFSEFDALRFGRFVITESWARTSSNERTSLTELFTDALLIHSQESSRFEFIPCRFDIWNLKDLTRRKGVQKQSRSRCPAFLLSRGVCGWYQVGFDLWPDFSRCVRILLELLDFTVTSRVITYRIRASALSCWSLTGFQNLKLKLQQLLACNFIFQLMVFVCKSCTQNLLSKPSAKFSALIGTRNVSSSIPWLKLVLLASWH